jgi:hypothetical protein
VYLFFFVAFLAQVLPSSSHFSSSHGVFLGGKVFLDLWFYAETGKQVTIIEANSRPTYPSEAAKSRCPVYPAGAW